MTEIIKPFVTHAGQTHYHEPIGKREVPAPPRKAAVAVAGAFGGSIPARQRVTVRSWREVPLRWMRPDGKGGLVPK